MYGTLACRYNQLRLGYGCRIMHGLRTQGNAAYPLNLPVAAAPTWLYTCARGAWRAARYDNRSFSQLAAMPAGSQ